jgi:hypothetical protein
MLVQKMAGSFARPLALGRGESSLDTALVQYIRFAQS